MSSFFTLPASARKRKQASSNTASNKRVRQTGPPALTNNPSKKLRRDESISGSDSEAQEGSRPASPSEYSSDTSGDQEETAAERRLRLAQRYLENIKSEVQRIGFDAADVDRDLIAERLNEDVAESKGRLYRHIASSYDFDSTTGTRGNCLLPNLADVLLKNRSNQPNGDQRKSFRPEALPYESNSLGYKHHTAPILCAAASSDGRFVATGGVDKRIVVWDAATLVALRVFTQHRDTVTSLAFRRGTNQLYSSSADRTIKSWSLDELAYVETLFGHQDQVVDVAALGQERCLSAGARDRTVRLWKVVEETQLVFRGGGLPNEKKSIGRKWEKDPLLFAEGSIDRVAFIDDETFVTGSDNGTLALWSVHKKKPVFQVLGAHGQDSPPRIEETFTEQDLVGRKAPSPPQPRWITALAVLPYSDLVLTGSWDGFIRVWRVTADKKRLEFVAGIGRAENVEDEVQGGGSSDRLKGCTSKGVINDIDIFEWGKEGRMDCALSLH